MKVKRIKGYKLQLDLYSRQFGLILEPLEIFVDNTFARQALINQLAIRDQFESATRCSVKLVTSSCVIKECEALGTLFDGTRSILLQFKVLNCRHQYDPTKSVPWCLKKRISRMKGVTISGDDTSKLYGIATNDESIQKIARCIPGVPIFYVAHSRFNLEPASASILNLVDERAKNAPELSQQERLAIEKLSEKYGLSKDTNPVKRKKGPKEANPLSRKKKSRKIPEDSQTRRSVKNRRKRKRRRIHMTWAFQQVLLKVKEEMGVL